MLLTNLAARVTVPIVSIGPTLSSCAGQRTMAKGTTAAASSIPLGVATGLVWAPCAGPVLGLILTGAATSLAAGVLFGRRLLAFVKQPARWGDGLRRILGAAVVVGAATIWLGLDTGLLKVRNLKLITASILAKRTWIVFDFSR